MSTEKQRIKGEGIRKQWVCTAIYFSVVDIDACRRDVSVTGQKIVTPSIAIFFHRLTSSLQCFVRRCDLIPHAMLHYLIK